MRHYESSSNLKNTAKEYLTGNYVYAILLPLLVNLTTFGAVFLVDFLFTLSIAPTSLLNTGTGQTIYNAVLFMLTFVSSVFTGVLNAGIALFFLNIACGQYYSLSDLFYGFGNNFSKALTVSAAMSLPALFYQIPSEIFTYRFRQDGSMASTLMPLLFTCAGLAVYIPISLSLSMSFYLMLDFPQYSASEILRQSMHIMRGNKRRLFYIELSFLPLMLLGILSLGIGFLWLTPYMQMTYTLFFLDLMRPKETVSA